MISDIAVHNEIVRLKRSHESVPHSRLLDYGRTAPLSSDRKFYSEWLDANTIIVNKTLAVGLTKIDLTTKTLADISSTIYVGASQRLLRDTAGDGKVWIVTSNSGDYGLYVYNGISFTKKLSDSSIGYMAYGTDGFLYYKTSTGNYYKCYNNEVTVVSNPNIYILTSGSSDNAQPNGDMFYSNGILYGEQDNANKGHIHHGQIYGKTNLSSDVGVGQRTVYGASNYACLGIITPDTVNFTQRVGIMLIKKGTYDRKALPFITIPMNAGGTPVLDNNSQSIIAAKYVGGEGLHIYADIVHSLSGTTHSWGVTDILVPITLNF